MLASAGAVPTRRMAWRARADRGRVSGAEAQLGFPRNVGDPVISAFISGLGRAGTNLLAPGSASDPVGDTKRRRNGRYRQAKETKCGGMGGRKS